ncbi:MULTISPECIES: hypothetical protein [Arthrospira]|nr:hypothetical protein [Arthrospira platensis]MDF2207724.1 hypothetical protein [Arthrospira platensis NCB002]MDT9181398.1 hypothetical protein [Limnospira sp. PMC 289.06]MDT9293458.1 hypothetical protein [Arthrospira platensis PCC 7345]MDT9309141.1 hypothetical protein [Limnospira sp. Paracas R14]WAK73921.1 hypothetical protein AP9108_36040 [Arthrospira sp. PCC 9108]
MVKTRYDQQTREYDELQAVTLRESARSQPASWFEEKPCDAE